MDATTDESLDYTDNSQLSHSSVKTSTVVKENIKWNEDAFFKRQKLAKASESLFLPSVESPIASVDNSGSPRKSLQTLKFPLNNSFVSEGANSSLGIINVENYDLSDSLLPVSVKHKNKKKSKKKLQRASQICLDSKDYDLKKYIPEEKLKEFLATGLDEKNSDKAQDGCDSNSSDIEYDGTNIPELNMDCDILSLLKSNRVSASKSISTNITSDSETNYSDTTSKRNSDFEDSYIGSQLTKEETFKSSAANRKSSVNVRQSIFEDFNPLYDSLYQQLASKKESAEKKENVFDKELVTKQISKVPQTIKVCPFLDVSSFEIEPILHKNQSSAYSDVENTRCSQNLSVDFCPEQISARSSSFKSSRQFDSPSSVNVNFSDKSSSQYNVPFQNEDLENEVLSGSHFQTPIPTQEFQIEERNSVTDKDSGFSVKSTNSETLLDNVSSNTNGFEYSDIDLQHKNISGFVAEGENWCSRLGLSESDFFSCEAAKEILKKDKEAFEKEQLFQPNKSNKVSSVSNWSFTNQHEVTRPSWLSESSSSEKVSSSRHISVGTLIGARSENLGTLSENFERDRPHFGKLVSTPPKNQPSSSQDPFELKTSIGANSEDSGVKTLRMSDLSDVLENISTTDPVNFASKIVERLHPEQEKSLEKRINSQNAHNSKTKFHSSAEFYKTGSTLLSDIEESENTLIKSVSSGDISKHSESDADSECKSTTSEPVQGIDNSLNFSVSSSSERESIKTTKSDTSSNCSAPSQRSAPQQFSRPISACSSACNIPLTIDNAVSLQYGCMQYLNSCTGNHQNCFHNIQAGNSGFSCPHTCTHHTLQPNLLSVSGPNSVQTVLHNTLPNPVLFSGTSASFLGIQVPPELNFPGKISLGDSQEMNLTIRNSGSVGCYYQISYVSAYLNESPLPFEMSGLSCNKTVLSNVGGITDVKLILAPKYEGKIEVNLQIDAFSFMGQSLNTVPISTAKTKIQYEVISPSITITSKGKNTLNIGQVVAGSTFVEYVTVINNCEVPVPLRISLSNNASENQIYFGLKEMDRQKHPSCGILRFLSPKVLLYRIPASKSGSVPSSFDIPIIFESINGKVESTVTAAIETPTMSEVLAYIKISVNGCDAKLVLKDSNQNPLILKAFKGAMCNHSVTVINVGNLPVVYDIHIDGDNDVLSVSPNSLNLQPKQCATISVTFTPSSYHTAKGNLLAAAEPHGQVFTVTEIIGQVKENPVKSHLNNLQMFSSKPTRDSTDFALGSFNLIECNKKFLDWGGVDIDSSSVIKTCIIRNPKEETIELKLYMKSNSQGFLLINDAGEKISSYETILRAREEKLVSVTFIPKSVISYVGLLCIKQTSENDHKVFTIHLSGYGGRSNIKVLGLPDGEGIGYCLDVDASQNTDVIYKNIVIHNVGFRPAFVKLLLTYNGIVQNTVEKQTAIHPSELILLENEKRNILVSINCMNKNLISSNEVISILYGDEIMRQKLKRNSRSSSRNQNLGYNIDFSVPYDGEEKVPYDPLYKSFPGVESLFNAQLKKLLIHIFINGHNTSFSRMSFAALSEVQESFSNLTLNSSHSMRRLTIDGHSPPVKESATVTASRLSLPIPIDENSSASGSVPANISMASVSDCLRNLKFDTWTVQPKELNIDPDNKDNRILLKSYSDSDLRFKIECTIDVITVSPRNGILHANKEIGLRLTLINLNHNKLLENYQGNIKIECDGIQKIVKITVFKDHKTVLGGSSILSTVNETLRSGFIGDSYYLDDTLVEPLSSSLNIENIFSFPKTIDLQKTAKGVLSETILIVNNPTKQSVTWNIHPTTMQFTQPFDDSIDCSTSAIEFYATSGNLRPSTSENIVIKFLPKSVAQFSQFFELSLSTEKGKNTCNIKVQGEAVADFSNIFKSRISAINETKQKLERKKVKTDIFTETEVCQFPVTTCGQRSMQSIQLKNISNKDNKLTVLKPKQPFIIKYSTLTVKSGKFLTVPVHFKPHRPGHYESEMKFVCENGNEIKIKLNATCSE